MNFWKMKPTLNQILSCDKFDTYFWIYHLKSDFINHDSLNGTYSVLYPTPKKKKRKKKRKEKKKNSYVLVYAW